MQNYFLSLYIVRQVSRMNIMVVSYALWKYYYYSILTKRTTLPASFNAA